MFLITLSYVWKGGNLEYLPNGGANRSGKVIEQWLYSGGLKRFLYNMNKKYERDETFPVVLNVVEIGKLYPDEIQNMIQDGYKFMAEDEDHKTLYQ